MPRGSSEATVSSRTGAVPANSTLTRTRRGLGAPAYTVVAHLAGPAQPGHRAVEEDMIVGDLTVDLDLGQPDDEAENARDHDQHKGADEQVVGPGLHARRSDPQRRPRPRAVEIGPHPGVLVAEHIVHRPGHQNAPLRQNRDTVANCVQAV